MNNNGGQSWPQNFVTGNELGGHDMHDDFSGFLDFSSLPLDFSSPYGGQSTAGTPGEHHEAMDTDFNMNGSNMPVSVSEMAAMQGTPLVSPTDAMGNQFGSMSGQMNHAQQHYMETSQPLDHTPMIPPTPTSMELHGNGSQPSFHHMNSANMMAQYAAFTDDPMFTPLLSPAVPPVRQDYVPDYTKPDAFSPLTSPALTAYHHRTNMIPPHMNGTPSPRVPQGAQAHNRHQSMDQSQLRNANGVPPSPALRQSGSGLRRKSISSRLPAGRVVLESPSMKPQRKRAAPAQISIPKVALEQQTRSVPPTPRNENGPSQGNTPKRSISREPSREPSPDQSVSPEPLPEVLMAPPPPPTAHRKASAAEALRQSTAPVTPASLMKLAKTTSVPADDIPPVSMDTSEFLNRDITIGEPSSKSPERPKDDMATPTMKPESRTPSLTPSLRPKSSTGSGVSKPSSRNSKRGSVSSSPALAPKISPSIKPLLPQGMSPDASALLLASKSNYQNIVEGNYSHLGLQYPEHLSQNLTSKRTSHKLAEQGRRNRINNALAELATLLPAGGKGEGKEGGTAAQREQTSKASTVELAIEYIKKLKQELAETKDRVEQLEKARDGGEEEVGAEMKA